MDGALIKALDFPFDFDVSSNCISSTSYLPDSSIVNLNQQRNIRLNIHFMNNSKGDKNYEAESGIKYAKELIYHANRKLQFNKRMNLPEGNSTPAIFPNYQYILTPSSDDDGDKGIYFHRDDELYYYVNEGKRNNYKREVINKYAVGEDSILNVFYMVHHPDSIASKTYSASGSGVALGKSIKLGTQYNPSDKPWLYASLLNHEVGHVLGLGHTWNFSDGCDDTPKNDNCWSQTENAPCDGVISNNMMDYNTNQHAITPCQIAIMQRNMSKRKSKQRDLIIKDWCKLDSNKDINILGKKDFSGSQDIYGNLNILPGGILKISCRLSMPQDSEITVYPGGILILDGAELHNDCGLSWRGIKILQKGKISGQVFYQKAPKFEQMTFPIDIQI